MLVEREDYMFVLGGEMDRYESLRHFVVERTGQWRMELPATLVFAVVVFQEVVYGGMVSSEVEQSNSIHIAFPRIEKSLKT